MKIEKYFDKKLQKTRWRFDVTVAGVRYRESGLRTRAICEEMIDELRLDARLIKRGLKTKHLTVTLEQLAEARLADPTTGQLPAVRKAVRTLFALIVRKNAARDAARCSGGDKISSVVKRLPSAFPTYSQGPDAV